MKMKALVVNAKREPKPGYVFDEFEQRTGIVRNGAMVWKDANIWNPGNLTCRK